MFSRRTTLIGGAALACAAALPARAALKRTTTPLVIGHRGASALRPEHTLASYAKAIEDGADFIEPDLVATKDGVLVARHENNIAETTDVEAHPQFASRRTSKMIDGQKVIGWFTEDFTLFELKQLRARERLKAVRPESQSYDGAFQIVTFEEIVDFTAAEAAARGRPIGLIPEIKHSTYFASIGLPLEPRLLEMIGLSGFLRRAPLVVQSFEVSNLKALRPKVAHLANIQLMQLIEAPHNAPYDLVAAGRAGTYADMLKPAGLTEIATYADWLSPPVRAYIPLDDAGRLAASTGPARCGAAGGPAGRNMDLPPGEPLPGSRFPRCCGR
jgi:glycerophosphoryl diester phosphodiesterase